MFKRLISLGLATILCSSMLSITVVAEETEIEKHNHMYEFPFKCEFWIERPSNLGSYFKELNMSCGVDIDEYGKITYTYYSMEDFQFNEQYECAYSNYIAIPVSYDLPYWYDCNEYFWKKASKLDEYDAQNYICNTNYQSSYYGVCHNYYCTYDNYNENNTQYIELSTTYYDKLLYIRLTDRSSGSILNIHNNDIIAQAAISPVSRIFKDEQGDMFIKDGEEKNYFMDDVSVTVNGHKVSRTIGTVKAKYNVAPPIEGDVNCDGEVNVTDVVLLQKWLLAVPDTHLENWQAVDLCRDNRLDVFDLCLLKRKLIEDTYSKLDETNSVNLAAAQNRTDVTYQSFRVVVDTNDIINDKGFNSIVSENNGMIPNALLETSFIINSYRLNTNTERTYIIIADNKKCLNALNTNFKLNSNGTATFVSDISRKLITIEIDELDTGEIYIKPNANVYFTTM